MAGPLPAAGGGDPAGRSWEYYYERAQVQYRGEMLDYALHSLELCLDIKPDRYEAANLMAAVYARKNMKDRALEYYRVSLRINDRQADIHYAAGELCEFFAERELAFAHYARAAAIDPDHVKAHCGLAHLYYLKGDPASARHHFEKSYRLGKAASGALLERAEEAERAGDLDGAAALFGRVIEEAPATVEAYLGLYEVHRRKGDYAKAAAAAERLVFVKPDHEKAYLILGDVYFTRRLPGRRAYYLERAVNCYKRALELNPENYEACLAIADIYDFMKRDLDARAWKDRAMKIEERVEAEKAPRR